MISIRDMEYIDNRLSAPAVDVVEAIGRLRQVGLDDDAERLMIVVQEFTDKVRRIRQDVRYTLTTKRRP